MDNGKRNERVKEEVTHAAAKFLSEYSPKGLLVTVTRAELSNRADRILIFLSVFPDDKEKEALQSAKRQRSEFKAHLERNFRLSRVPFVDFLIDRGEKNRRRLEEISDE